MSLNGQVAGFAGRMLQVASAIQLIPDPVTPQPPPDETSIQTTVFWVGAAGGAAARRSASSMSNPPAVYSAARCASVTVVTTGTPAASRIQRGMTPPVVCPANQPLTAPIVAMIAAGCAGSATWSDAIA